MQTFLSKLSKQFSLVILQEFFKSFFTALPAALMACKFAPIMWMPMQELQEKLALKN